MKQTTTMPTSLPTVKSGFDASPWLARVFSVSFDTVWCCWNYRIRCKWNVCMLWHRLKQAIANWRIFLFENCYGPTAVKRTFSVSWSKGECTSEWRFCFRDVWIGLIWFGSGSGILLEERFVTPLANNIHERLFRHVAVRQGRYARLASYDNGRAWLISNTGEDVFWIVDNANVVAGRWATWVKRQQHGSKWTVVYQLMRSATAIQPCVFGLRMAN